MRLVDAGCGEGSLISGGAAQPTSPWLAAGGLNALLACFSVTTRFGIEAWLSPTDVEIRPGAGHTAARGTADGRGRGRSSTVPGCRNGRLGIDLTRRNCADQKQPAQAS